MELWKRFYTHHKAINPWLCSHKGYTQIDAIGSAELARQLIDVLHECFGRNPRDSWPYFWRRSENALKKNATRMDSHIVALHRKAIYTGSEPTMVQQIKWKLQMLNLR